MRPLKLLTFDAYVHMLAKTFERIPDTRASGSGDYSMTDALMSAFAMFFFQEPSLLAFQRKLEERRHRNNLETMFKVKAIPSDTQMREIIDGAEIAPVRRQMGRAFERVRRVGWGERFKTRVGSEDYYTAVLDGTQYFHSTKIECPSCLKRTDAKGVEHYSHQILAATLVKASSHQILPLDVEAIENEDGTEKQDCETNAAKRLLVRLRQEHRQMKLVVSGDAIYAHEPMVSLAREQRMKVIFVAKPGSQPETFEWVEELERTGGVEHGSYEEGSGPKIKRRVVEYRFAAEVPISQKRTNMMTFVEAWVRDHAGKQVYHNSWVTDLEVTHETVAEVIKIGRSRWKVENEQFNVHKNGGYHLEHNYGHGEKTLSMMMVVLNLLAFLLHQILVMGDRLYERCRATASLEELWNGFRTLVRKLLFESWTQLLEFWLDDSIPGSP